MFPRLLKQRMLCLGSPSAKYATSDSHQAADAAQQQCPLGAIMDKVEEYTKQHRVGMIAVKDTGANRTRYGRTQRVRIVCAASPACRPHCSTCTSPASTTTCARSAPAPGDMRRKLKTGAALRVEWRHDIDGIDAEVMRLYRSTMENRS
jgi:hypothetical protein